MAPNPNPLRSDRAPIGRTAAASSFRPYLTRPGPTVRLAGRRRAAPLPKGTT